MNITFEFATQDDCLDKMAPSDLRKLVRERDYFKNGMAELQDIIDKMQPERDALAAQVEVLREAWEAVKATDWNKPLDEAFAATPAACLAQVKADAGRAGYMECVKDFNLSGAYCNGWAPYQMAESYANGIRQEVV